MNRKNPYLTTHINIKQKIMYIYIYMKNTYLITLLIHPVLIMKFMYEKVLLRELIPQYCSYSQFKCNDFF